MSLPEAARQILDSRAAPYLPPVVERAIMPFALPKRNADNVLVMEYLCGKRCIDKQIVEYCISANLLYESQHRHNCVFVGRDMDSTARHAFMRGTGANDFKLDMERSDKRYSFMIPSIVTPWSC